MISVHCTGCGATFSVAEQHAGRKGKCKHCGTTVDIVAPWQQVPGAPPRPAPPQPRQAASYAVPQYDPQPPQYPAAPPPPRRGPAQYAPPQYAPPQQQYAPQQYAPQQYAPEQYAAEQYPQEQYAQKQYASADEQAWAQAAQPAAAGESAYSPTPSWKKKKKSSPILPIAIAGGALVLVGGGFLAYRLAGPTAPETAAATPAPAKPKPVKADPVVQVPPPVIEAPVAPPPKPVVAVPDGPMAPDQIVEKYNEGVVLVKHETGTGTGFVVRPGVICTNYHVISGAPTNTLQIQFPGIKLFVGTGEVTSVLYADPSRDLAVLAVRAPKVHPPELVLADEYKFRAGQAVTIIGNPGAGDRVLENAVASGLMSTQVEIRGQPYYQLSAAINPGNSGGPLFDARGRVVGVVTLKARGKEGIGYCIPVDAVQSSLKAIDAQSSDAADVLTLRYNAAAVYDRLETVSNRAFQGATFANAAAAQGGKGSAPRAADVTKRFREAMDELNQEGGAASLEVVVDRVKADPQTPSAIKTSLGEYWDAWEAMRTHLSSGTLGTAAFRTGLDGTSKRFRQAAKGLQSALGDLAPKEEE